MNTTIDAISWETIGKGKFQKPRLVLWNSDFIRQLLAVTILKENIAVARG